MQVQLEVEVYPDDSGVRKVSVSFDSTTEAYRFRNELVAHRKNSGSMGSPPPRLYAETVIDLAKKVVDRSRKSTPTGTPARPR